MESVLCVISILGFYCNLSASNEPIPLISHGSGEIVCCILAWHLGSKYSVSAEKSWKIFVHLSILWRNLDSFTGHSGVEISFIVQRNIYAGDEHLVSFSVQDKPLCILYTGQSEARIVTQWPISAQGYIWLFKRRALVSPSHVKFILWGQ